MGRAPDGRVGCYSRFECAWDRCVDLFHLYMCVFRPQILWMYLLCLVLHVVNLCCRLCNIFLCRYSIRIRYQRCDTLSKILYLQYNGLSAFTSSCQETDRIFRHRSRSGYGHTEGVVQAEVPIELMAIAQRDMQFGFGFGLDEGMGGDGGERDSEGGETTREEQNHYVFGYLLAWILIFDLFGDVSFKVKSNYIEQLRNHDVVVGYLIPCFLSLLRLDQGSLSKVFKLDVCGVDAFYIDCQ